jgi:hypothetical protein
MVKFELYHHRLYVTQGITIEPNRNIFVNKSRNLLCGTIFCDFLPHFLSRNTSRHNLYLSRHEQKTSSGFICQVGILLAALDTVQ